MARLFGTDGVRGRANEGLTAELALDLSVAAAHVLGETGEFGGTKPVALVGRDPRASGEFLEAAVVAGLASAGVNVVRLGVVPTPGVAYLVGATGADLGVMLSASHNPMPDNGIKFFARGGVKLGDQIEDAIEARMGEAWQRPVAGGVGRVQDDGVEVEQYIQHLVDSIEGTRLDGLTVVVDAANGAASHTAVEAFTRAGARVVPIHHRPDGLNINENCGSTHLGDLQRAVVAEGADLGIGLDGDADRCLAVDKAGNLIDGDQELAIIGLDLKEQGRLPGDTIVATVMSNLGFVNAMADHGIRVERAKVGDRYVLEMMNESGFALGGEQSGHVVMSQYATTGDGVLTGLHLMARMARTGKSLAELASVMTRLPQVLVNVGGVDKARAGTHEGLLADVQTESDALGTSGRVLLRPSGTEQLVRVMVEAGTQDHAQAVADRLAASVRRNLAL
ncbi:phosphoglucosamine mutase [Granulicoccus phenolivorans]|uniref:phosphoglucosamine mutase n=1 Tax=Granulicoccus phenolivorans TaxID=266854 RepID=UPI0004231724|nr:phosphoglucosamine mutase [Granulicoccus phenolivorans]